VLRLFDTATGTIRPLELRDPGRVAIYSCGLTVSDVPHIGHGRGWLVFDVLRRYLTFCGLEVRFVSNVTDIDDKIIARAAREGRSEPEVAAQFEAAWWDASAALGVLAPNAIPHATSYVEHMVELVSALVDQGAAYETSTGVYLDVNQVPGYGLLARQPLDSLRAGARVELDDEKRSPLDFVLWKKARPDEPTWDSRFGPGRPGWHTECVVMSLDLLGEGFDLHGGGMDLMFPHHENERAQAVARGRRFARHWMHHGWVMMGDEKMSKSLGNFTTVSDLLRESDARAYRLLVLRSQYRSQIEVTPETIADAEKGLERLDRLAERFDLMHHGQIGTAALPHDASRAPGVVAAEVELFCAAMDDDLDTPGALAQIFDATSRAHSLGDAGNEAAAHALASTVSLLCAVLGLALDTRQEVALDDDTQRLVDARDAARAARDFGAADAIRDQLVALGYTVEDSPSGTQLRR
jgi:cysteinyl-tRNA synthetase